MFDRFSEPARNVVVRAQNEARQFQHNYIGTEHILLGLLHDEQSLSAQVLRELGLELEPVRAEVLRVTGPGEDDGSRQPPFTPKAKKVLEYALREALALGDNHIGPEHILLGLSREDSGVAARIMADAGVTRERVVEAVNGHLHEGRGEATAGVGASTETSGGRRSRRGKSVLEQYGRNLSELAQRGELDPVIGRQEQIERVLQILSRRTKNNPILLGEPGVGKTAVVEGFAQYLLHSDLPAEFTGKQIYTVDLALIVAGTKLRGEFEDRLKKIVREVSEREEVIIFIDEIHSLIGAGAAEGALDAASILKPALARGEFQVIGATTMDEYRKYFEKDAAVARRFQPVDVPPPSAETTVEILRGLRDRYEQHHKVDILDEALEAASQLSDRYIADRFLPDKAIDLMDEAASRLALKRSMGSAPNQEHEQQLQEVRRAKEEAIEAQDFQRAAELRTQERELQRRPAEQEPDEQEEPRPQVTAEMIAEVVAMWTGIPVTQVDGDESQRLLELEDALHQRVIGQDRAVVALSKTLRRSRAGLGDPRRPMGSFLFLGPTGVGKTELARTVAEFLFGDERALIRLDMSEYMEQHAVSRLVGAPPGYIGYDEGGQLTEAVRRRPYSVVLLDEIEKAHPDVFNILLQVLEDGRLTDSQGRVVDFRNTIIIMTSNLGAQQIVSPKPMGFALSDEEGLGYEEIKQRVESELKRAFRPEFLNRVDEVLVFSRLEREEIKQVVDLLLVRVRQQLADFQLQLEVSETAKSVLVEQGWDPTMGARPLRRAIQRLIEDPLADLLLTQPTPHSSVLVEADSPQDETLKLTVLAPLDIPTTNGDPEVNDPAIAE